YQALSIAIRLEAASAHGLVTILYEELVRALDVSRAAIVQARAEALRSGQERACSILLALEASLDLEKGGDLAHALARIYRSMQRELSDAVRGSDGERLVRLREGAAELLGAWVGIGVREAA